MKSDAHVRISKDYDRLIVKRLEQMEKRKQKIVLASVAKDIENSFLSDFKIITEAFIDFDVVRWLIIESNSTDDSVHFLEDLARKQPLLKIISLGDDNNQIMRTTSIATARNRYLDEYRKICATETIDYLVVADLNELNKKLNRKAVLSCFTRNDWAGVCANQDGPYYDIYALRHDYWSPNDCWVSYREMQNIYNQKRKFLWDGALWDCVYSRMITINRSNKWIKVHSAFGGLAIYDSKYLSKVSYKGETESGDAVCEHVYFNFGIEAEGGKIYINPDLINFRTTDHSLRRKYFFIFNSWFYLRRLLFKYPIAS